MPYFFRKLGKILQKLSSAAVVIGALRVKDFISDTESNILSNTSKMLSSPCPPIYEQNMRIDQQPLMSFPVPPSYGYGCPSPCKY